MLLVIAPAPTPTTPAASPSPSLAPSATPSASVGTPAPLPVKVLDDPGPDWVDITGLIVATVASAFSIVLAQRAVSIGRQANTAAVKAAEEAERANVEASKARAAVANERRRTFELEVLRDLAELLDDDVRSNPPLFTATVVKQEALVFKLATNPRLIRHYFRGYLLLLPEDDLPTWRRAAEIASAAELGKIFGLDQDRSESWYSIDLNSRRLGASQELVGLFLSTLHVDVYDAIERRMSARDD